MKEMDTKDADFDTERHEAISVVPVAEDSRKERCLILCRKATLSMIRCFAMQKWW